MGRHGRQGGGRDSRKVQGVQWAQNVVKAEGSPALTIWDRGRAGKNLRKKVGGYPRIHHHIAPWD